MVKQFSKDIDRKIAVPQFWQHIFENWKHESGPCRGCPNHALKEKYFPATGQGDPEADIMILGNSPGPRPRDEVEISNDSRKVSPDRLEELSDFDGKSLHSMYGYSIEHVYKWNGIDTLRNHLIEHDNGLGMNLTEDVYLTNGKRCPNIAGCDNQEALRHCNDYLATEIGLVDPDVVVACGLQAAEAVARTIGYDLDKLPNKSSRLPLGDTRPFEHSVIGYREPHDEEIGFITLMHWAMDGPNIHHIPNFDVQRYNNPVKEYYYQVADVIQQFIDK